MTIQIPINPLLLSDSYKYSHHLQMPPGTDGYYGYGTARSSQIRDIDYTINFGLQMNIKQYLMTPFTKEDIAEAKELITAHGEPFPEDMLLHVLNAYGGYAPVNINALKEGTKTPLGLPMFTVEAVDDDAKLGPSISTYGSFIETLLLKGLWYPSTVATISRQCKELIKAYLKLTSDVDADQAVLSMLQDFAFRGVSSNESAGIGGLGHLVNFRGTDTVMALVYGRRYYNAPMAGFSIPASEHSTMTSWGMDDAGETAAFRNMIKQFGRPGSAYAIVSDGRNIYNAVEKLFGDVLRQEIIEAGGTLIVRPDSGDPVAVVCKVVSLLAAKFGYTMNSKGFRVLNNVRVIQGDGINYESIKSILFALQLNGYSTENVSFGMGGGLLQSVNRDTFGFALKCSAIRVNGVWKDVYKDPIAGGKTSRAGRVITMLGEEATFDRGQIIKVPSLVHGLEGQGTNLLEPLYRPGQLMRDESLEQIRVLADSYKYKVQLQ